MKLIALVLAIGTMAAACSGGQSESNGTCTYDGQTFTASSSAQEVPCAVRHMTTARSSLAAGTHAPTEEPHTPLSIPV